MLDKEGGWRWERSVEFFWTESICSRDLVQEEEERNGWRFKPGCFFFSSRKIWIDG